MIPSAEEVLAGYAFLARRRGFSVAPSERSVRAALETARALAKDQDEPAAILYAFASYRRAFPEAWRLMAGILAIGQARRIGCHLDTTRDELDQILSAVMYREASFADVHEWVAGHLRPLASAP